MPKFSIIIPTCGDSEELRKCVEQVNMYTINHEIIVVSNGAGALEGLKAQVLVLPENLGFPKAVNRGINLAAGEIVILLNDDTLVTPHWADHLAEHLKYADMVGPFTNNCSGPQCATSFIPSTIVGLNCYADEIYDKFKLQSSPLHRLVFFCVAIKREVIDKIGLLDEQFSPGNFEDDDYCLRAIEAGFRLVVAWDVFIHHIGGHSFKKYLDTYRELLRINKAKFDAKWPTSKYDILRKKCYNNK
jgi:GT2 family glycosyltransferase